MAKSYEFLLSSEAVNSYGYRILTDGIQTEQYLRNPVVLWSHIRDMREQRGKEVIGRCVKLEKRGTDLFVTVEFDSEEEFAKTIEGKVERGFIRMVSLSADVLETSMAPELLLPGQLFETVTKCKLVEISICDIGGNDDALRLSRNGAPASLQQISKPLKNEDMDLKTIALALGKDQNADMAVILQGVQELKLAKDNAEAKLTELKGELSAIRDEQATQLVDRMVSLGLVSEGLKSITLGSLKADFKNQYAELSKLATKAEEQGNLDKDIDRVKTVVLQAGGKKPAGQTETFDYLQRHDVARLRKLQSEKPEEYARLVADYKKGVRHQEKQ